MKVSKSGIFLFELIVVIFLFTISSAICISIFAKSFSFSTDSENLTIGSMKAQTAAEVFKESDGDHESIRDALQAEDGSYDIILTQSNSNDIGDYVLNLYYDEEWNNSDKTNHKYKVTVRTETLDSNQTGETVRAGIQVSSRDKSIFDINADKYLSYEEMENQGGER